MSSVGDGAFEAFNASLSVATIHLTATFSANVYRGLSCHNAMPVCILSIPIISFTICSFFVETLGFFKSLIVSAREISYFYR